LAERIITNAGPLIALARIGRLNLLSQLFTEIIVPRPVIEECTAFPRKQGAAAIAQAVKDRVFTLKTVKGWMVADAPPSLGSGELAAIELASQLNLPVLLDDKLGRAFASHRGVVMIGLGGLLIAAKRAGYIAAVAPLLDRLRDADYRLSQELIKTILQRCDETVEQ
jgi:predicted nucleic acid-binding protein